MINLKNIFWKFKTKLSSLVSGIRLKWKFNNAQNGIDATQAHLDKKLVSSLVAKKFPNIHQLRYLSKTFSPKELLAVKIFSAVIVFCFIVIAANFYFRNFEVVPAYGGEYSEGLIGPLQYTNPLLSQTNDVDSDISSLIFSGLLKYGKDLSIVPDLAENYEISEDEKTYIFNLRQDASWHDGQKLTADDVVFTFKSAQDPNFKSPVIVSLRGIAVEKTGDYQIKFTLNDPYPAFLDVMTTGILPAHIWGEIPAINANLTEYNIKPIGSGPWQFKSLVKDRLGNIKSYTLTPYKNYYGKKPYLEKLIFKFYPDFESAVQALNNQSVNGISYLPKYLKDQVTNKNITFYSLHLPQYTAVFFNQKNNEILKDKNVRRALALAIDKTKILTEALRLEGQIIDGPILPGFIGYNPNLEKIPFDPGAAGKLLEDAGFKKLTPEQYQEILNKQKMALTENATSTENAETAPETEEVAPAEKETGQDYFRKNKDNILELTLTTVNLPENVYAAELIRQFWQNVGIKVNLRIIESSQIIREVIKPRLYDILLYGEIVGADPDPYPFWHSSQVDDPGLNLALYSNRKADALLQEARATTDVLKREQYYQEFQSLVSSDIPAIFLYNPTYSYILNSEIKNLQVDRIILPSDRFNNILNWYLKTARRWHGSTK